MRNFDFYEFAGILTPGVILLVGLAVIANPHHPMDSLSVSAGAASVLLIVSYAAGHLLQSIGNAFDGAYWWAWGGKPTDWVFLGKHHLLSPQHVEELTKATQRDLSLNTKVSPKDLRLQIVGVTRQLYAALQVADRTQRAGSIKGDVK